MTELALHTFPTLYWPEDENSIPRRLFHFSPLVLHECIHHGMEEERDAIMNANIFYGDDWAWKIKGENEPFALIAFPDDKADELYQLLNGLIGEVRELHFVDMENGKPRFKDVTVYPPPPSIDNRPSEILLSMAANVMRRHSI